MDLFSARCPWFVAGPALGLLVIGLLAAANRPLGASGGFIDLVAWIRRPSAGVKWTVFFLCGVVVGGFLSALAAGGVHPTPDYGSFDRRFGTDFATRSAALLVMGTIMGFGARTAGGCTSAHGICGTSLGSRASWIATATFMGTAMLVANGIAWVLP